MRNELHPRLRDLADLRDGRLTGTRTSAVKEHVGAGCDVCATASARFESAVAAIAEGPLPAPPRSVVRQAVHMFRAKKWAWLLEAPGRIVASLVLDQRMELVPALRSSVGAERRMLWMVGDHELAACVVLRGGHAEIVGQILPAEDDGSSQVVGEIEAMRNGRSVAKIPLDADGGFALRGLSYGTYALLGRVDGAEFVVAPLEIGDRA
ncbi:MAG: hypothetical protein K8T90_13720 [Planctomycetes bacterium]|nr:hypothetical protein [Planctomycetota bacterium]